MRRSLVLSVAVLVAVASGCTSESSPGDPSSAGVVDYDVSWSPDSRLIAFDRSDYGPPGDTPSGPSDIFVANADGNDLRQLTQTPESETVVGWLANPPRIVFSVKTPTGPTTLHTLDPSEGAQVILGELPRADQLVALSHDARQALVGTPFRDPERYALVDIARGTRRPLPGETDFWWVDGAWSADGSMLAYVTDGSIVVLREGHALRRVPGSALGGMAGAGGLAWSPDGHRLAYGEGGGSLWLVRVEDGSRWRLVTGDESVSEDPVWSSGGSTIYYRHGSYDDSDGLRAIAPDGTGDRKITDDDWGDLFSDLFSSGAGDRWLEEATPSPDGTKIAYLLGERGAWKNWSLVGVMSADGSDKTPLPGSP
ncbi:MAG: hypothetical protein ACRC50_05285 [Gaiella sp.]